MFASAAATWRKDGAVSLMTSQPEVVLVKERCKGERIKEGPPPTIIFINSGAMREQ